MLANIIDTIKFLIRKIPLAIAFFLPCLIWYLFKPLNETFLSSLYSNFVITLNKISPTLYQQTFFQDCLLLLVLVMLFSVIISLSNSFLRMIIVNVALLVFVYRFFSTKYIFYKMKIYSSIAYIDCLWVVPLIYLLFIIYSKYFCKLKISKKGFLRDSPIKNNEEDLFNRTVVAKKLAKKLLDTNCEDSFACGIVGPWGAGKTSFINLTLGHIRKDIDAIIVNFNPWKFNSPEQMLEEFFRSLRTEIGVFSPYLLSSIKKYVELLINHSQDIFMNKSVLEQKQEINNLLKARNRKIFVVIDDFDRLDEEEINQVIKLIRNTADFNLVTFLVAYDKNYIADALAKKITGYKTYEYLEKIFQFELYIPTFEDTTLLNSFLNSIKSRLVDKQGDKIGEIEKAFSEEVNFRKVFFKYVKSIRDLNRLCNAFIFAFELIAEEVCVVDLLKIELLKMKFNKEYERLRAKDITLIDFDLSTQHTKIKKTNDDAPYDLLTNIFDLDSFSSTSDAPSHSIKRPYSYDTYFAYHTFSDRFSRVEFRNMSEDISKLRNAVEDMVKSGDLSKVNGVIRNFEHLEIESKNQYENVIEVLFNFGSYSWLLHKKISDLLWSKLDFVLSGKPNWYSDKKEFKEYVIDLIKKNFIRTDYLDKGVFIVSFITYKLESIPIGYLQQLGLKDLFSVEIANQILTRYLKEGSIDNNFWSLCFRRRDIAKHRAQFSLDFNDEILKQIKESGDLLKGFLEHGVKNWDGKEFTLSPGPDSEKYIFLILGDQKDDFLKDINNSFSDLVWFQEFSRFYSELEKNNFMSVKFDGFKDFEPKG